MILSQPCGYKRDPRSSRPPCALPQGHTGQHSYYRPLPQQAETLIDYDAVLAELPKAVRRSPEEVEAKRNANGGWDRDVLASWGIPWPPPKGWKKRLTA